HEIGPRSVYADREGRARLDVQPARLSAPAGVWYDEFANLVEPVRVSNGSSGELRLTADAAATDWADGLTLMDTDPGNALAHYEHPHLGRWPAVTSKVSGDGRITVVGTVPNQALARTIAGWLVPRPVAGWADLPDTFTVSSSTAADGTRIYFVHNWS